MLTPPHCFPSHQICLGSRNVVQPHALRCKRACQLAALQHAAVKLLALLRKVSAHRLHSWRHAVRSSVWQPAEVLRLHGLQCRERSSAGKRLEQKWRRALCRMSERSTR